MKIEYIAFIEESKGMPIKVIPLISDKGIDYVRDRVKNAYQNAYKINIKGNKHEDS